MGRINPKQLTSTSNLTTLVNGVATQVASVPSSDGQVHGIKLDYTVQMSDASVAQCEVGTVYIPLVDLAGGVTAGTPLKSAAQAVPSGSLTTSWEVDDTDDGAIGINLTATSNLTTTTSTIRWTVVPIFGTGIINAFPVDSVFGRIGPIIAVASDYDASQVDNDSGVAGATVAAALDTLAAGGGDIIELAITQTGDFSGNPITNVQALFPWDSPAKIADPASPFAQRNAMAWSPNGEFLVTCGGSSNFLVIYQRDGINLTKLTGLTAPAGIVNGVSWSLNGEFLAVGHNVTPFVTAYQRDGTTFTKLSDPSTLPGTQTQGVSWSPNGEFLAVADVSTPFVTIYQRDGITLTKLTNPGTLPPTSARDVSWSPNGEFLVVGHDTTPYMTIYQKDGTTFTKLTNPSSLPTNRVEGVSWSPNGEFLALAIISTPYINLYQRSGTTFTKQTNPTALAGQANDIKWSPNGEFVAVAHFATPFVSILQLSGTTLTKQSDPGDLPAGTGRGVSWSPNGEFLSVGHTTSPYMITYQTASDMPATGTAKIVGLTRSGT